MSFFLCIFGTYLIDDVELVGVLPGFESLVESEARRHRVKQVWDTWRNIKRTIYFVEVKSVVVVACFL